MKNYSIEEIDNKLDKVIKKLRVYTEVRVRKRQDDKSGEVQVASLEECVGRDDADGQAADA